MSIFSKELKMGLKGFIIWTASISFMLVICVFMFPEMKNEMQGVSDIFSNMGGFTAAFGMDKLNFGTLKGFYGIECGNILGIGGGFYAAYSGIAMLSKEENQHTAEFLFSHPITRVNIIFQKLLTVISEIVVMNIIIFFLSVISVVIIGEAVPFKDFFLIHLAFLILQVEIGCICFGLSAFTGKGSIGIGLGIAALLYFANIICNISDKLGFLKYITPYSYAEPSTILTDKKIDVLLIALGFIYAAAFVFVGFVKYSKKDIKA